jgi:hypothetical protein
MADVKRINIDDPQVDMDMSRRLLYRGELFTGEVEEYLGGARVSLETYVDGLADGRESRVVQGRQTGVRGHSP